MDPSRLQEDETASQMPRKPEITPAKNNFLKTFLSLAVYIGVYYIFFHQNMKWVLFLVLVIIIHELGHFVAMKIFGYNDVKMFFVPFLGAYVSGEPRRVSQYQRAITLLAGPVPGILIGLLMFWLYVQTHQPIYHWLALMFIALNALNLLPVGPLDGGQLMENIFFHSNRIVQSVFIILSCVALFYVAVLLRNYFLLLIIWLLIIRFRYLASIDKVRKDLDAKSISYNKTYTELSDEEYRQIRAVMISHIKGLKNYDPELESDDEGNVAAYMKNVLTTPAEEDLNRAQKIFIFLVWMLFLIGPVFLYLSYGLGNRL